jgi:hypothetical protein
MEDYRNLITLDRTFETENTLAENSMLKNDNKFLITTTLLLGVLAIGLFVYTIDQELQKK